MATQIKTYALLESMDVDSPFYQQLPDNQRVAITKIPRHRPFMHLTFQDKDGVSRTIRYKANSNYIYQDQQLEKEKIDANAKFTQNERDGMWFVNGFLTTNKKNLQEFLEAHPEYEKFEGTCDDVRKPCYKLLDKAGEEKVKNSGFKKTIEAGQKIISLSLDEAREMLIRINGSFFATPNTGDDEADLATCQNMLIDFIDATNEAGLEEVLKETINVDDTTKVLIGKLINAGTLSFDAIDGKISKKDKSGKWIDIRDMSATYSMEEKLRMFSDFLNTTDGKALKNDLEKDASDLEKATTKKRIDKT